MKGFKMASLRQELDDVLPATLKKNQTIERALILSFRAHEGQYRTSRNLTGAKIPYIVHPIGVAKNVIRFWDEHELPHSLEVVVCAALTHDVLEDTAVDYATLASQISKSCADLVIALTKPRVNDDQTRAERNVIFAKQIIDAGSTAIYLKLCDAIHNISRPESMPTTLLNKTIDKISGPYMNMLNDQPFKSRLQKEISLLLNGAREHASSRYNKYRNIEYNQFEKYLTYCLEQTHQKVLEIHDLIEIISDVPGVQVVHYGELHSFLIEHLNLIDNEKNAELIPEIEQILTPEGEYASPLLIRFLNEKKPISRVIAIDFLEGSIDLSKDPLVVVVNDERAPEWLSFSTLKAIITVLAQRLNSTLIQEYLNLSEHLQSVGLNLSGEQAAIHGLAYADIQNLDNLINTANFVCDNLKRASEKIASQTKFSNMLDRLESRVKQPNSILNKLENRSLNSIEDIDDLVGLRLVFLTNDTRNKFANLLQDILINNGQKSEFSFDLVEGSLTSNDTNSNLGYSATHIKFRIASPTHQFISIGCEIQLRTLHEDAWARISEHFIYKLTNINKTKAKKMLKDLAQLRNMSDKCIDDKIGSNPT